MSTDIPRYALYGETVRGADLGLVHCQALFSNIERQNWEIQPHRHVGLHQFVVLNSGEIEASIEGADITMVGPVVASIPSDCVHGFGYSPNVAGRVLTVANEFQTTLIHNSPAPSTYAWLNQACLVSLSTGKTSAAQSRILRFLDIIEFELSRRDLGAVDAIAGAMKLLLITLSRERADQSIRQHSELYDHHQRIGQAFQILAADHYREHWDVKKYCAQLGVSPKQLGRICDGQLGRSPLMYLHELLSREAQRRLIYTNSTVAEVAYALGFKDPAYFSRFFRRMNGVSPSSFIDAKRNRLLETRPN